MAKKKDDAALPAEPAPPLGRAERYWVESRRPLAALAQGQPETSHAGAIAPGRAEPPVGSMVWDKRRRSPLSRRQGKARLTLGRPERHPVLGVERLPRSGVELQV